MKNRLGGIGGSTSRIACAALAALVGRLGAGALLGAAVFTGTAGCAAESALVSADRRAPESATAVAPAEASAQPAAQASRLKTAGPAAAGAAAPTVAGSLTAGPSTQAVQAVQAALPVSRLVAGQNAPVATVGEVNIPASELLQPLIEAHGLNMLLSIVQRDLARHGAETVKPPVVVTEADFNAERERTLAKLFHETDERIQDRLDDLAKQNKPEKEKQDLKKALEEEREAEHRQVLLQLFEQKKITQTDLDIAIQTNTYLRKIAEPKVKDKITEDMLKRQYAAVYGEKVRVRHIQLGNPRDVIEIRRELAAGKSFEELASRFSMDPQTRALGGQVPEFTRADPRLPQVFKEVAFQLKEGQVSDLVNVEDTYHLIKLEKRIPPRGIKYEDERDIVYRNVYDQLLQGAINFERDVIGEQARKALKITDPTLAKQFQDRLDEREQTIKSKEQAEKEMEKERERTKILMQEYLAKNAATRPSTQPAQPGATQPAAAHPIATQPTTPPGPLVPPVPTLPPAATRPLTAPPSAPAPAPAPAPASAPARAPAPPAPAAPRPATTQPAAAPQSRAAAAPAPAAPPTAASPAARPAAARPTP